MQRKEILIDLDNCVYPFVEVLAGWLEYNGVLNAGWAMANYTQWNVWSDWGMTKGELMRWWRLGIEAGIIYGEGAVIPGAREVLWDLSDKEFSINLITNRLNKHSLHRKVVENTVNWLMERNIPYRALSFTDNKSIFGAKYGIDDNPANVKQMLKAGVEAYLFPSNHNLNDETQWVGAPLPRVTGWEDFADKVEGRNL